MRETAIRILGIATLGFYVDSALADIRLDGGTIFYCNNSIVKYRH